MAERVRLGELLVEAQIITREQLEEMLRLQESDPRRLGTLLVEGGLVSETQVTQILSQQLSIPWVSLYHIDFSRQLLNLVPRDLAEKYCLVPIFVRRVRGFGDTLYVAMDDPTDEAAQKEIGQYSGLPIRAMIAPPSDIRAAIRAYYSPSQRPLGSVSPDARETAPAPPQAMAPQAIRPAPEPRPAPPKRPPAAAPPPAAAAPPPAPVAVTTPVSAPAAPVEDLDSPDSAPTIEAREVSMPLPKRGTKPRMMTLTLLDGTKINLPAKGRGSEPVVEEQLTARDLVAALRAAAHGAAADKVLGDDKRWERLFAALLTVLMKKQLIADWEFIEELKQI